MDLHYKVPLQHAEEINPEILLLTVPFQSEGISL